MPLLAQPLTAEAFAPFGDVFSRLDQPGRVYTEAALGNGRPDGRPDVDVIFMWRVGTAGDGEFVAVAPFTVTCPSA
jgi:hypothetical protein